MFKKSGTDSQSSRTIIEVSLVMGELTGISFDLK
jgi:hypothetical protein